MPTDMSSVGEGLNRLHTFQQPPTFDAFVPSFVLLSLRGMPLYLGQLQSRPPNQYSAILTYRPERPSVRADAILALNLSGTVPLMCFLAEGRILALTGYHVGCAP